MLQADGADAAHDHAAGLDQANINTLSLNGLQELQQQLGAQSDGTLTDRNRIQRSLT
jgi:hypothetical protein